MNIKKADGYTEPGTWEIEHKRGLYRVSFTIPYYTQEDWKSFEQQVCIPRSLNALIEVLRAFDYKTAYVQEYIKAVSERKRECRDIKISGDLSSTSIQYHKALYHYLFIIPLEDMPLYINETDVDMRPIVEWRLQNGK